MAMKLLVLYQHVDMSKLSVYEFEKDLVKGIVTYTMLLDKK